MAQIVTSLNGGDNRFAYITSKMRHQTPLTLQSARDVIGSAVTSSSKSSSSFSVPIR
jgi:hypothetical protein